MIALLCVGLVLLAAGAVLLVNPSAMLFLLDRGYYTRLSPLRKIRRQPAMIERYQSERRLLRYLLPLAAVAIGAVWTGFAIARL